MLESELVLRKLFLSSRLRWFDWIHLCRNLLHKLQVIHSEGVILGSLTLDSVHVRWHDGKLEPCIVDFRTASYSKNNRVSCKEMLGRLPGSLKRTAEEVEVTVPSHVRPELDTCKYLLKASVSIGNFGF